MEKLIFIFRRKPGMSREDYFDHYLTVHSPLGLRLQPGLSAYTVNLLDSPAEFDAVTEIWTPAIASFLSGEKSDNVEPIIKDHQSFMGPQDTFAVEERVLRDGALTSPLSVATPGVKMVSFYRHGESLPEPPASAYRVVDNVLTRTILLRDQWVQVERERASDLAVIRAVWANTADELGALPDGAVLVREYRHRTM